MKATSFPNLRLVLLALSLLLTGRTAFAHSMYQSAVLLDFHANSVEARMELPPSKLSAVFGQPVTAQNLSEIQAQLEEYIHLRFRVQTAGQLWSVHFVKPLRWENVDGAPYVTAQLELVPPSGIPTRRFSLEDGVITESVPSHVVLVSVRSDWNSSTFASDPDLVGVLNGGDRVLEVDRGAGDWRRGFASIFHLGTRHIAEGTDHLLFLLALLLPAPLLAVRGRWALPAGVRRGFTQILKVVTAFTVGHSLTLALAASGLVTVHSRPIETLIAVSILVSAIHALRPLFPGREFYVAGGFGLVHGLAFASTLAELGLRRWERVESILAFNLGIEAMQLVVVICIMPSLMLLSRTKAYTPFRITGAVFAAVAACGWIIERATELALGVDIVVNAIAAHAVAFALFLFIGAVAAFTLQRRRSSNVPAERF